MEKGRAFALLFFLTKPKKEDIIKVISNNKGEIYYD